MAAKSNATLHPILSIYPIKLDFSERNRSTGIAFEVFIRTIDFRYLIGDRGFFKAWQFGRSDRFECDVARHLPQLRCVIDHSMFPGDVGLETRACECYAVVKKELDRLLIDVSYPADSSLSTQAASAN